MTQITPQFPLKFKSNFNTLTQLKKQEENLVVFQLATRANKQTKNKKAPLFFRLSCRRRLDRAFAPQIDRGRRAEINRRYGNRSPNRRGLLPALITPKLPTPN